MRFIIGNRAVIAAAPIAVSKVEQKLWIKRSKQFSQTRNKCFAEDNVKEDCCTYAKSEEFATDYKRILLKCKRGSFPGLYLKRSEYTRHGSDTAWMVPVRT
jgi:hypothetical protein